MVCVCVNDAYNSIKLLFKINHSCVKNCVNKVCYIKHKLNSFACLGPR